MTQEEFDNLEQGDVVRVVLTDDELVVIGQPGFGGVGALRTVVDLVNPQALELVAKGRFNFARQGAAAKRGAVAG